MSRMVEVVIDSVRVSLTNQQRIVVLRELNAERYLSIWIGPYEAEAITIALQEIEVARPQTHDLLKNTLSALGARLVRVEVLAMREDVYYGNLVVEAEGKLYNIDSRPSDALALAVRARVPVLVAREVMDTVGISPQRDLENQDAAPSEAAETPEEIPESEGRLSVFEDFMQNLSLGDDEDADTPEDDDEPDENNPRPI